MAKNTGVGKYLNDKNRNLAKYKNGHVNIANTIGLHQMAVIAIIGKQMAKLCQLHHS